MAHFQKMLEELRYTAKFITTFLLFLVLPIVSEAQNGNNPFDIRNDRQINTTTTSRVDTIQKVNVGTGNPFDIVSNPEKIKPQTKPIEIIPTVTEDAISLREKGQSFLFSIVVSVLILLTILVVLSRSLLSKIYQAFFNDIILKTLYRERGSLTASVYIGLYILFLLNLSVFAFLALYNFNKIFNHSETFTLLYSIAAIVVLFVGKHLILNLLSFIFPIEKEINLYGFTIMIFSIIVGLILAPINVFLAYSDAETAKWIIIGTSITILGIYIFRSLRSLILAQSYIIQNFFHFVVYICAVEIAPVLILLKIVSNKIQLNLF